MGYLRLAVGDIRMMRGLLMFFEITRRIVQSAALIALNRIRD
jgi:hypothetical protein